MSFDSQSMKPKPKLPTLQESNNTTMDEPNKDNLDPLQPNLKHIKSKSASNQYHYNYNRKNKHLSQQIHKKKKNRNKQTQYKKKKLIKLKQNNPKSSVTPNHKKNKKVNSKRPRLNKGTFKSTDNHYGLGYDRDDFEVTYIKQYPKMRDKHKKIQVVNHSNDTYDYLTNLDQFNDEKQIKRKGSLRDHNGTKYVQYTKLKNMPSPLPFKQDKNDKNNNLNQKDQDDPNNTPKIWWIPTIHKPPSPMLLPAASMIRSNSNPNKSNLTISSPFLLPVCKIPGARNKKVCNISSMSPSNKSVQSDHHETKIGDNNGNNKGECILGFEANNANILFRSLSDIRPLVSQPSKPMSIASDYKYEGMCHHTNPDRIDYDISNCLNMLRSINNSRDNYYSRQLSLDKLNEMEMIIQQLKTKIIDDHDHDQDEDEIKDNNNMEEEDEDEEKKVNADDDDDDDNEYQTDVTTTTIMTTDSSLNFNQWRSRRSLNTNSANSSDDEHENEDEEYDDDEDRMGPGLIAGVRLIENPTPDGDQHVDNVQYYD